jgi:hypothetical protein
MANSNGVPASFGGSSSGYQGANDAAGSGTSGPAAVATPSGPQGPNAAGLNPGSVTTAAVPAPGGAYSPVPAFQAIASKRVIDGSEAGQAPAVPAKPFDEKQLVTSLADALGVKASKGEPLEVAVVNELADKYGVKIEKSGETTRGTGTGQGEVGQLRHNIASWFGTASSAVNDASNSVAQNVFGLTTSSEADLDKKRAEANAIKSPKLRALAIKKLNAQLNDDGRPPQTPEPVPIESTKALNEILTQVASRLGVSGAGPNALEDIAKQTGAQYEMPATAAVAGSPQTYAQNFQSFVSAWNKNQKLSNGQTFQNQWIANLEYMGQLNAASNTANLGKTQETSTKGGLTTSAAQQAQPTEDQVFNAYQNFLVSSNSAQQSPLAYMQAAPNSPTTQALRNGPASEMFAFTQGIAQEMGVGLTTNQINQISNFYGASASVADDPSSVEDQIRDAVVALYSPPSDPSDPNSPNGYGVVNPSGVANTMFVDIQQQAAAYQIPVSAGQITSMIQNDLQGATVESLYVAADAAEAKAQQSFEEQAKGLYPALAPQIAEGSTVQQLTAPYLNVAEAITGVPASTMQTDITSGGLSKWSAFLQGGNNTSGSTQLGNSSGQAQAGPQMQTLDQWKTTLMQNPIYGFSKTQGAQDMAEQMTSAILNEFGKVNTTQSQTPISSLYQGQSDLSANTS